MAGLEPHLRCLRLQPELRPYPWGDSAYLRDLFGATAVPGPCAEAWYGAHKTGSAQACVGDTRLRLTDLLAAMPELVGTPDGQLPYLVKILAAQRPASIQVHPDCRQAGAGFAAENAAGIALDAVERCFRDANGKPEILIALGEVEALCGFEPAQLLFERVRELPELAALLPGFRAPRTANLVAALHDYFQAPAAWRSERLTSLLQRCRLPMAADLGARAAWMLKVHAQLGHEHPDQGLIFFWLLRLLRLQPGQALYMAPGVPHTYLHGAGVEVMANSDNVLRAGLTDKYVAPERMLATVSWDSAQPAVIDPVMAESPLEIRYPTPAQEFAVRLLRMAPGTRYERRAAGPETLLVMADDAAAEVEIRTPELVQRLGRGGACLLAPASHYEVRGLTTHASVYLVTRPDHSNVER